MTDGKPSVSQIAAASRDGYIKYEIVTYRGVEILMTKAPLRHAVEITFELTHDTKVEELAGQVGIKLRRFR